MREQTTFTFSAKMNHETRAELEKRLPDILEEIGISEYNLEQTEQPTAKGVV